MKGAELSDSRRKQEVKTGEEITSREESFWSAGGRYRGDPRDFRPNSVAPQNTQHQQPWKEILQISFRSGPSNQTEDPSALSHR